MLKVFICDQRPQLRLNRDLHPWKIIGTTQKHDGRVVQRTCLWALVKNPLETPRNIKERGDMLKGVRPCYQQFCQ